MPSSRSSRRERNSYHKCTCGGDADSTYSRDSDSPSHRGYGRDPHRRNGEKKRGDYSSFLIIYSILLAILILLGSLLAFAAFYTTTLPRRNVDDLRTFEYEYHLQLLMYAIGVGGIIAAITGIIGLLAINPKVGTPGLRVFFEMMLLLSAVLLLILGTLALGAIYIRRNIVDEHFRPIMKSYQHEETPNPFLPLHRFQAEFRCCSLANPPEPYMHLQGSEKGSLPWSCCAVFTSETLKDPEQVQAIVDEAAAQNCAREASGSHTTNCDRINPELADWALGSGIEALAISLYCLILLVASCIGKRVVSA